MNVEQTQEVVHYVGLVLISLGWGVLITYIVESVHKYIRTRRHIQRRLGLR